MVIALERFLAKHVEMNHHARMVMFLRAQNVITELEAEEYLNPQVLSHGAATLLQTNMAARQTERRGVLAHGIMFGVLALMLGLIHVAPLGATPETQTVIKQQGRGFVRVSAYPWATVSVDGEVRATTPRATALEVTEGNHIVRFTHPWYQPVERTLVITPSDLEAAQALTVDFEQEGKLLPGARVPAAPVKPAPVEPADDDGEGSAAGGVK
jgi:serine/threonine-protein kinase